MSPTDSHATNLVISPQTVVVVERSIGDDIAVGLTDSRELSPDTRIDDVATAIENCVVVQNDDSGCVVVVSPDAADIALTLDGEIVDYLPAISVPTHTDRDNSLPRHLDSAIDGGRTAQSLDHELRLLTDALNALDDIFYVFDANGHLVRWNDRLTDVVGLTDAEIAGMRLEAFFIESSRQRVQSAATEALAGNDVIVEAEAEAVCGRVRFELTGRPIEDDEGNVIGFSGVARDVTCPRKAAERLARENEKLDAFGRVLTHDLRNPLNVATGFLEQYQLDHESPELDRVARALERIDEIINEVRHSSHRERLDLSRVSLAEAAKMAWDAVETQDALLVVDTRATIEADPKRLQRLLENLFRNAVDHAGAAPTVRVGDTPGGFTVDDDGPGVPAEVRKVIFQTGFTTAQDGTGYGLSIVRELAAMHDWRVDVSTNSIGGSRFEVHGVTFSPAEASNGNPDGSRDA